jgi:hypothetical protein
MCREQARPARGNEEIEMDLHEATTGDIIRRLTDAEAELYETILAGLSSSEQQTGIIWGELFGVDARVYAL